MRQKRQPQQAQRPHLPHLASLQRPGMPLGHQPVLNRLQVLAVGQRQQGRGRPIAQRRQ